MSATILVPAGYVAIWLGLGLAGVTGGGRAVGVYLFPAGIIVAAGAAYVALDVGNIACRLGEHTRRKMEHGWWPDQLQLVVEPDQVRALRAAAVGHVLLGVVMCFIGVLAIVGTVTGR